MKHIIIGGVAGGATAAARIRRADEQAEILLVEKGKYISYANCGLPYYIGGVISERDKLFVQTPEGFARRFNINVLTQTEAVAIDTRAKTVTLRADGREWQEQYDRLLLSPGSSPVRPPLPGIDSEGIFTLRNVEDTDNIKHYMQQHAVREAVVVGGGFIGLEMAENLHRAGTHVSIVEMANQVMAPVDFSIASHVHRELMDKGVSLYLEKGVDHFEQNADGSLQVFFGSGESIKADLVLLSIGVRPNTELAKAAGIALGTRGIKVNSYLQTSAADVYAVGDAIEYPHPEYGEPWLNYLAGPANRQGRIVADNMVYGNRTEYEGAIGTSIAKVFSLTVGSTGLAAKRLRQLGIGYESSITVSQSHAGYYPGSFMLTTKLTFDPKTGKLYGAQCVGHEGVDKRIDQISILIKHGGTISDLTQLEHAYAPPFSSAKDPIAIAGYTACNIASGQMPVIHWRDISQLDLNEVQLVDTRTPEEFETGTIEGAVNIPLDDLRQRMGELSKDRPVVVFCAVGLRGYLATRTLMANGFSVRNLSGGYKTWALNTQRIENLKPADDGQNQTCNQAAAPVQRLHIDACGLQCPGPIMKLKQAMDGMKAGEQIEVTATDAGFPRDARAWCKSTGNQIVSESEQDGYYTVVFCKQPSQPAAAVTAGSGARNKTLICFSDDLDRTIATFVLANGAAATGHKVSIFFTFWGLNVIKKEHKPAVKKDFFGRMFAHMLPKSSRQLHLSQMSMMGMGDRMIRYIMRKKNIASLEELRQQALNNGVEFIACQMTMDMMGIKKEELLDGVTVGGVATYMERAENAGVNLFI